MRAKRRTSLMRPLQIPARVHHGRNLGEISEKSRRNLGQSSARLAGTAARSHERSIAPRSSRQAVWTYTHRAVPVVLFRDRLRPFDFVFRAEWAGRISERSRKAWRAVQAWRSVAAAASGPAASRRSTTPTGSCTKPSATAAASAPPPPPGRALASRVSMAASKAAASSSSGSSACSQVVL